MSFGVLTSLRAAALPADQYLEIIVTPRLYKGTDAFGLYLRATFPGDGYRLLANCNGSLHLECLKNQAHIHHQWQQREGQKLGLNPGSIGMPINGDPRAQYALLTCEPGQRGQWRAELHQVDYDHVRVKRTFQSCGLLEAGNGFARACMLDLDSAKNTVWDLVQHAFSYARARDCTGAVIPDGLWLEAISTFDWVQ